MFKNLQVVAVLMCMLSYTGAETASIGTASARGDLRVNNYAVKGNATLFNGSVVETGQATADLRLSKGNEIRMATSSKGTLYSDRLVLQRGESQLDAKGSFQLEAKGLRVTPTSPNSSGVVSVQTGNTVQVAALTGSFGVTNSKGVLLASVRPGHSMSFAMQATPPPAPAAAGTGSTTTGATTGATTGTTTGTTAGSTAGGTAAGTAAGTGTGAAAGGATAAATGGFLGMGTTALIATGAVVAGAGIAAGVVATNSSSTSASR